MSLEEKNELPPGGGSAGWILAGFRKPPGSHPGVQPKPLYENDKSHRAVASGSAGFPEFGAAAIELPRGAPSHRFGRPKGTAQIRSISASPKRPPTGVPALVTLRTVRLHYMFRVLVSTRQYVVRRSTRIPVVVR